MTIKQLRYLKEYLIIKLSGLFDAEYYHHQYPSVQASSADPLMHYIKKGWQEGKNPSPHFDTDFYLDLYRDVENADLNPLYHFIKYGRREQRRTVPFDSESNNLTYINLKSRDILNKTFQQNAANPPQTPDIIIFPIIDWFFRFQRPQQLALQLANSGHRIFYINTVFCRGDQPRISKLQENIYFVQLSNAKLKTPINTSLSDQDLINLQSSLQTLRDIFIINSAIMLIDLPFWADLTKKLQTTFGWKSVYDCMDLHLGFSNHSFQAEIDEEKLIKNSDLVIASSHHLFNHIKQYSSNSILVSNGTDFDFFHQAKDPIPIDDLNQITAPIIGYYGAIADWFDTDLIGMLAADHPEWSFLLIGDTYLSDLKPLIGLKNVYLPGEKPYTEIPKYLSHFDVCLIPFRQSSLTHATNPVKMYEYLSAGKPIVATRLDELTHYSDYLFLAESKQEWEAAIQNCLSEEKTPALLKKRYSFAKANTWMEKGRIIRSEILSLFPKVSIIIVSNNHLSYTKLCLESILKNTEYPNYEIVIVDNASDEDTVNYLEEFCSSHSFTKLILNQENLGFIQAQHQGVQISDGDYLVLLNSDTMVTPGWISRLLWHLTSDQSIGMVGPVTHSAETDENIHFNNDDAFITAINMISAERAKTYTGQSFETKNLTLICRMLSRDLYYAVGGLDERYGVGMLEDDLAMNIQGKGLKLICAEDIFVHHFLNATFS
jgi:GT2 family glycosyltransferase/glycosyltransferase involved in cell wall biosynthesis